MKNKHRLLIILLIGVLIILFSQLFVNYYVIDVQTLETDFNVKGPKLAGFNLDPDAFHFGIIPPGQSAYRDIDFNNYYDFPIILSIKASGSAEDYIITSRNNILIEPNSTERITFYVYPPDDIENGNYSATLKFYYKRKLC